MGSLTDAIPDGSVVAIASVAFIYFFEQNPAYSAAADELFDRVEAGALTAVASTLLLTEVLVYPLKQGDTARANAASQVLRSFPNLRFRPVDLAVAERAAELRAKLGLRTPDAVHAATGILHGAQWLVSNDLTLRRVATEGLQPWLFEDHV